MGMLTKEAWQAKRKRPVVVSLESLGGAKVILRPMTAGRRLEIEKALPENASKGQLGAAVFADTVVGGELDDNGEIVSVGNPIWTVAEALDLETSVFDEVMTRVGDYLKPEGDPAKNSTPASGSHTV